jgi:hypothetical protein
MVKNKKGMWNKKSILEYWSMLDVRHSIDNMHVKKNVCEATFGTLLKQKSKGKDHKNAREDLKELGIRPELYAEETETGTNLPFAATTLSKAEKRILTVFAQFESTFRLLIKLQEARHERHFETLCLLQATFPPSFFDLMLHLTAHLTREIWFLGPSYLHQMFPYERFYGFLKSLVHNQLFPEGAIVSGYETIESVEWAMGYMDPQNPIGVPRSQHEGRLSGVGTMGKRSVTPDADAFQKAHFTVIEQLHLITPFANRYK